MSSSRSAFQAAGKVFQERGVSRRVRQITISAIKEMPLLASRLGGCVSLGQGIPSFGTPRHILDAARAVLDENPDVGKYTLGPGLPALRAAIAGELRRSRGLEVDPEAEICVTVGAMEGLLAGLLTLVDEGDEVILPCPNYASHIEQVILAGGRPVFVPLREGWRLDPEAMAAAMTPRTKAIILTSPQNPTGAVFSEADLRALAWAVRDKDIFILSDETYDFLVYDGRPFFSLLGLPELRDRLFSTFSFSKKYAMTGWRVGFVLAPARIVDQILKVHDAGAICAPTISQHAALAALNGPQDCVAGFRAVLQLRRDLICQRLDELAGFFDYVRPAGTYYLMARCLVPGLDSMTLALRVLNEARVITIPGLAFGPAGENHLRLCFGGSEEEINLALDRLTAWVRRNGRPVKG